MGKSRVRNFLRPPQDRVQLFAPPHHYGQKFKAPVLKQPQNCFAPPSAWLKLFMPPPLFIGVKLHMPPPRFVAPPPRN